MLDIYQFPKIIKLTDFIIGIQKFVTVIGRLVSDGNIPFELPLTFDELYYCFNNYN